MKWAFVSVALLFCFVHRVPQTLYSDQAQQVKALEQFIAGETPSLNRLSTPDPRDLTRNVTEWFSWWPPGTQLLLYPQAARGVPIGVALRRLIWLCYLAGVIGWLRWFDRFALPDGWRMILRWLFPWVHYASAAFFAFQGEILAFGTSPWILLGACALGERFLKRRNRAGALIAGAAAAGLAFGSVYILKYSIVFVSIAALLYLADKAERARRGGDVMPWVAMGLALALFLLPVVGLNVVNYRAAHDMNPVVTASARHFHLGTLVWAASLAGLALTDAYSLLAFIFLHPSHGLWRNPAVLNWIGLPPGALLLYLLYRRRADDGPARLALLSLATACAGMLFIWNASTVGNFDGRYFAVFSMAALPVAITEGVELWRRRQSMLWRGVLTAGAVYLLVPLLYGPVAVAVKRARIPAGYKTGQARLWDGFLADRDIPAVKAQLLEGFDRRRDVWFLPDYVTALELPGRAILAHADFLEAADLAKARYVSPVPMHLRLVLQERLEANGKGAVIRSTFPQAGAWRKREIAGSTYAAWDTELRP